MEVYIDHYLVLGLPSGEKGTKISYKDITKAYKIKALELHPDKKPNDSNAVINFQKLQASYEILKHETTRKKFDDDLIRRVRPQQERRTSNNYGMHTRWSDMHDQERERAAFEERERKRAAAAAFEEQERKRAAAAYEERERKRAALNAFYDVIKLKAEKKAYDRFGLKRRGVDKGNVLRVFWADRRGLDYSEKRLREIFEKFGKVEDVIIMSYVYQGSALIVMATKDGVAAAVKAGTIRGFLSNPLLVRPLFTTSLSM